MLSLLRPAALILVACLVFGGSQSASAQEKIAGAYQVDWPWDMVVDPSGRLFIASIENHSVLRFTPFGHQIDVRVSPSSGLDHPRWLAVDPTGIVYVSDGELVLSIPVEGSSTPITFGSFGAYDVTALAADGAGNVFGTTDTLVIKREPGGAITELLDRGGLGGNWLDGTRDVAVAANGDVYAVGEFSDNVFKITPGNVITEIIDIAGDGANALEDPSGLAVDTSGNVYVTGSLSNNAFKITPAGVVSQIIDSSGDGLGNTLTQPTAIAVAPGGNVYVLGRRNAFRITPGGVITEIIDTTGDGMGNTLETGPESDLVLDSNESVFVAAYLTRNVFRITLGGAITEILDQTGQGGLFFYPEGLAVDSADNILVTGRDAGSSGGYAFAISPAGVVTELINPAGDGVNTLRSPSGIGVDSSGTVTICSRSYPYSAFQVSAGGAISLLLDYLSFPLYQGGRALHVSSDGTVYLAGYATDNVWRLATDGTKTELITLIGDGTGQPWLGGGDLMANAEGGAYVAGYFSNNVFKIATDGSVSEIINTHGDLAGNQLRNPIGLGLDAAGNVYVAGNGSDNAFKIEPSGAITQILDRSGDGLGNEVEAPLDLAASATGDVFVLGGFGGRNAFHISPEGEIRKIIDATGDGQGNTIDLPTAIAASPDGLRAYVSEYSPFSSNVFMIYVGPSLLPALNAPLAALLAVMLAASGRAAWTWRSRGPRRTLQPSRGRDVR